MRIALVETPTGRPVVAVSVDLEAAAARILELVIGQRVRPLRGRRRRARALTSGAAPAAARSPVRASTPAGRSRPKVITLGPDEFHLVR